MAKTISILGATGTIGHNTLDIIERNQKLFALEAISANNNYKKLIEIAKKFQPKFVHITNSKYYEQVKEELAGSNIKISTGEKELIKFCQIKTDIYISAIIGIAALPPTLEAIKNCKILGMANKESIVCGGKLIIDECHKHKTQIVPIDSEHNSIFQLLKGENQSEISNIYLTASGGPFLNKNTSEFKDITIKDALKHPNWKMGDKITIDSATMINKGLEIIEAYYLFDLEKDKIDVIIHPEQIIHAIINFIDGSSKAAISVPDMRIPISSALNYPNKIKQEHLAFDITKYKSLNFLEPDLEKFKAIILAKNVLKAEGIMPIIFNAANEIFVNLFLNKKIAFIDIVNNIEKVLNKFSNSKLETTEQIYEIDNQTREYSLQIA